MATLIQLIKDLEKGLESLPLIAGPAPTSYSLSHKQYLNDLRDLGKQDNEGGGRFNLLTALLKDGQTPTPDQITNLKTKLTQRHTNLEQKLEALHLRQYQAFEQQLDDSQLPFAGKQQALAKMKSLQQTQIDGFKKREADDQRYLTNFNRMRNRAAAAEHILRGLSDNPKAMGTPYRFGPFAAINKNFVLKDAAAEKYDSPEEVAMDIAAESGTSQQRLEQDKTTRQWKAKEKEEKQVFGAINGSAPDSEELDWPAFTSDYLEGRDTLIFDDAPSAGIFKGLGVMGILHALRLSGVGPLQINLNATIEANKEKGIPAAEGAITCELPMALTSSLGSALFGGIPSPVIGVLNILAQTYMAKGWKSVELGYGTDKDYWDEAYLACRRAGFEHSEILFRGKLMTNQAIIDKGEAARRKIDNVYKDKNLGGVALTAAINKLSIPINDPSPDLDPQRFFHVDPNQRPELFKRASLEQRAAILANEALPEASIGGLLNYPSVAPYEPMTAQEKARVLEQVYEGSTTDLGFSANQERAFVAFSNVSNQPPANEKATVFQNLNPQTAAYILTRSTEQERIDLFNASSKQAAILKQEVLPDAMIYALYTQLNANKQEKILNELTKDDRGLKALGVIVAQMFVDDAKYPGGTQLQLPPPSPANRQKRNEEVVELLGKILNKVSQSDQATVMAALHDALPSDRRQLQPAGLGQVNDNFLSVLEDRNNVFNRTVSMQGLYRGASGGATQLNEAEIKPIAVQLGNDNPPQDILGKFYQLDAQKAANALLQSNDQDRGKQLYNLIRAASQDTTKNDKLVAIVNKLGTNVVAKALVTLSDPDRQNASNYLADVTSNQPGLLAKLLTIYHNINPAKTFVPAALNFAQVVAHIDQPELITRLLGSKSTAEIKNIFNEPDINLVQKTKIFRSLADDKKLEVFKLLQPAQQKEFFSYLTPPHRIGYLKELANSLRDPDTQKNTANKIIAHLNDPLLSVVDKKALYDSIAADKMTEVIEKNSNPTSMFLADHLNKAQNPNDLNSAFEAIMEIEGRFDNAQQKENYLNKVAQALVQLPTDKQQLLFDKCLVAEDQSPEGLIVRRQFLIHLASEKKGNAKAFFDSVPAEQKDELKQEIKRVADGENGNPPSHFKKELYAMIGQQMPRPPAAAPNPNPNQGQGQPRPGQSNNNN